jgi:hypothetical protein
VGVKAVVLDPQFKNRYLPEGGVFPDTIYTEPSIDWRDRDQIHRDSLDRWPWGSDEFYNGNITERTTPWSEQICDDGPCVEPMLRIYSRFDWVDDQNVAEGNPDWPVPYYNDEDELKAVCGQHSIEFQTVRTKTTGQVIGFFSHKMKANKPSRQPDVVWGFDPYRFNRSEIQSMIQWVLGEHFGLTMSP